MIDPLLIPGTICSLFIAFFTPQNKTFPFPESIVSSDSLARPSQTENIPEYTKSGFIVGWNAETKQPAWIAYELTLEEVYGSQAKRESAFKADAEIVTGTASNEDYYKSGYDRGHLAPAADMKASPEAMKDSFLYSNISPQEPSFNRGIWADLEAMTRYWAVLDQSLLIAVGPVFLSHERRTIGPNAISVPDAFYRVIADWSLPQRKAIAFLIPNKKQTDSVFAFSTTVDEIEAVTGLDFFSSLPDFIENEIEGELDPDLWPEEEFSLNRHPYPER